jgi:hypothetical protein
LLSSQHDDFTKSFGITGSLIVLTVVSLLIQIISQS